MARLPREDSRTAIPQLEKMVKDLEKRVKELTENAEVVNGLINGLTAQLIPVAFTPTLDTTKASTGSYVSFYKVGRVVIASINMHITATATGTIYYTGFPKPIKNSAFGMSTSTSASGSFYISTDGKLISDGVTSAGWHNGLVAYISAE